MLAEARDGVSKLRRKKAEMYEGMSKRRADVSDGQEKIKWEGKIHGR